MGLFLAMSSVIGRDSPAVADSLKRFATEHGGSMSPEHRSPEQKFTLVVRSEGQNTTALYPYAFTGWDQASEHLSQDLQAPVFSFHIHDGDLWMYRCFAVGKEIDCFNPVPDYWSDDEDVHPWRGDPAAIARAAGITAASIERYLVRWGEAVFEAETPSKAYADDEFNFGDDWQLLDFMRRLSLPFPLAPDGQPVGETFRFHCRV